MRNVSQPAEGRTNSFRRGRSVWSKRGVSASGRLRRRRAKKRKEKTTNKNTHTHQTNKQKTHTSPSPSQPRGDLPTLAAKRSMGSSFRHQAHWGQGACHLQSKCGPSGRQPHTPIPQLMAALSMRAQEELTEGGNRKGRQSYPPVPILGRHKIAATQYAP